MPKVLEFFRKSKNKKAFAHPDLVTFQALCDSEISFCVRHFQDGESEFLLGNETTGFTDRLLSYKAKEGLDWLTEVAARRYPGTWYAEMYQILRRSI